MTLPVSGPISFNNINVELGVSGTTQASLGQTSYRNLAGVPSGAISMSNFYGKANQFAFTISSNQANADLRTLALGAGWNGASKVVATINSGVYMYSNSTGSPALTVSGAFPNGVQLINNGVIIGRGGNGGNGGTGPASAKVPGQPGGGGGTALSVSVAISITNNNIVSGGGGGGGGGSAGYNGKSSAGGGGGGGGGIGLSSGGTGGVVLSSGGPGTGGTLTTNGTGGARSSGGGGAGGNGGSYGSAGAAGEYLPSSAGSSGNGAGGGAGACTSGNVNITWLATGSRYGALN